MPFLLRSAQNLVHRGWQKFSTLSMFAHMAALKRKAAADCASGKGLFTAVALDALHEFIFINEVARMAAFANHLLLIPCAHRK